jgi:SAM-dependent methyltransferase
MATRTTPTSDGGAGWWHATSSAGCKGAKACAGWTSAAEPARSPARSSRRDPAAVVGIDPSPAFVQTARRTVDDPRADFRSGDATALPFDAEFDVAVSGLVLNFVTTPAIAVAGMAAAVIDGGLVGSYVWDYAGRMDMMRYFWAAATALDDRVRVQDEGARFPICRPDRLADLWRDAGLRSVDTEAIDVPTPFATFDDYWLPFLGGQGPAAGHVMSLDEGARAALRERLRGSLPTEADGSISLIARAWAVKGTRRA